MSRGWPAALIRTAAAFVAASVLGFLILKAMPGDPVLIAIHAWNLPADAGTIAAIGEDWGLDRSLVEQYGRWLLRFVVGDWGLSIRTGTPVAQEFARRLPLTLTIGFGGLLLAIAIAIPFGFRAALHPRGAADLASRAITVFVQAVPAFWLGLLLIFLFAVQLRWFDPFAPGRVSLLLPVALVGLHSLGTFTRVYRRALREIETEPFLRTALAKGLSRSAALWRHGHRHAIYALVAAVRAEAGWAIGGTATVEVLFGLPGVSQFLVESIRSRDFFVLQAYVMTVAAWLLLVNLAVEFALRRLDPRTA